MSEKRVIKINEDMFKIPSKTQKKRKESSSAIKVKQPKKEEKNHTLKRKLLQIIRNKQKEKIQQNYDPKDAEKVETFENEFNASMDYLSNLSAKHSTPKLNSTLKTHVPVSENVHLELPSELLERDVTNNIPVQKPIFSTTPQINMPKYGCLKNGSLPTFRTWKNQTQKNTESIVPCAPNAIMSNTVTTTPPITAPPSALKNPPVHEPPIMLNNYKQTQKMIKEIQEENTIPLPKKQKKTIRRNFTIGRHKHKPVISVLVSNRTLRNRASTQQKLLQQTPIEDVKKHLVKQGLIKIGCIAPNDVLRQMYECSMMMCGEVKNHNPDYLLHNFLNRPE